jgi:uncharacterized protein (TIGR02996 family)
MLNPHDCLRPICQHPGEEAFLAALLDSPEDEVARLVYADWLEDRADIRAEFLRAWHAVKTGQATNDQAGRRQTLRNSMDCGWLALIGAGSKAMNAESYRAKEVLALCVRLQQMQSRWPDYGIAEMMRMAVLGEPRNHTAIVLCRLLFCSRSGDPLRRPGLGEPGFPGNTTYSDWPLEPVQVHRGVPFYIVRGWGIAGLPESAPHYLAYCLQNGVWNSEPYALVSDEDLSAIARDFVASGPWKRRLDRYERRFILSQVK